MKLKYMRGILTMTGSIAVGVSVAGPSVSAQTATTTTITTKTATKVDSSGVLTTSKAYKGVAATATPDMINEAIQRSKARSAKTATGAPERFGSEEPFTYDPTN